MQEWTPAHIRFLQDAAAYGTYHARLAELLLPYFPRRGHLCDAGCGLGDLTLALAPYFQEITACDIAPAPLETLRKRAPSHVHVVSGDIFTHPTQQPYDGMVFCLFGHGQQAIQLAREQCRGPVAAVVRGESHHFLSQIPRERMGLSLPQRLREQGIPFLQRPVTLEYGQPLASLTDAKNYARLYQLPWETVERQLQPIEHPQFSWYLPRMRRLWLVVWNSQSNQ